MRLTISLLAAALLAVIAVSMATSPATAQILPGTGIGGSAETSIEAGSQDLLEQLLHVLQDPQARAKLEEQLKAAVTAVGDAATTPEKPKATLGTRMAEFGKGVVSGVVSRVREISSALLRAPEALSGLDRETADVILDAVRQLILLIATSAGTFLLLRALAKRWYRRVDRRMTARPAVRRVWPFVGVSLVDLLIVFIAWIAGAFVAVRLAGSETIGPVYTPYLTAFLVVELLVFVLRIVLAPTTASMRLLNLSDQAARRLYLIGRTLVSLVGYGFLLVLPLVSEQTGFAEERSTAVLIWLVTIVYLAAVILYFRRPVGHWLLAQWTGYDDTVATVPPGGPGIIRAVVYSWHWLALFWLFWLLVTVLTRPPHVVNDLLEASAKVAVAVIAGLVASGLMSRLIERGIALPQGVTARVPLLEHRLNRHVPRILLMLRLLILAAVVFYAFQTLNLVRARGWMDSEFGLELTGRLFTVALMLLAAFLAWLALSSWVDYRLNPNYGDTPTAREQTLLTLLRNAGTIAILALGLMFILSELGLNIGPLLASAGVVGLAIGFGAQRMVQDIITGIFIQFENAINVGDVVSAGGTTGAVERLTVRSVSLRDVSGVYHIIPFSSVDTVSNFTRDFSFYVIDMDVAYRESVPEVKQAMHDAFEELRSNPEHGGYLLGDLEWFGLDAFGDNSVVLKCRIKTWPGQQWGIGRAYNEIVKRVFDERGIEIPFPQRNVWFGEDRSGNAPPLRVRGQMQTEAARPRPSIPSGRTPHAVPPTQDTPTGEDGSAGDEGD